MTRDELLFSAWLTSLNFRLGRYAVRLLDEVNPLATTTYTTDLASVEAQLGDELRELANALLDKAAGLPFPVQPAAERPRTPMPEIPEF
ncbi:hypothetical protein FHS29_005587 [Saccharothrix tamanrassetensis]|uniref:Uncharacterized protein n=1 Tax=Saccharothrix tamanrassetensis TaxID=1051531 RepID=A0A841CS53_9PSEU|nr:hypothetical protein [Saccharothrix tamanrassetensis]MBB5958978.1 hypothetical protein [Saccharothrix tamanrassetensis]